MSLWEQWEAIYNDPANPRAADEAQRFYQQNREAMQAGARVLWPEEEDLYALMRMRAESGRAAFEREKQNSPIHPEMCEWPESYFDEDIWFENWPAHLAIRTLALDPSKGSDARRGDYSALVSLGVDGKGILYVEAMLTRCSTPQMVAEGVAVYCQFHPDAFGVEANQFQELLGAEFEAEFSRQGLLGVRPWLLDNRVNKLVRIRRLGPYLASRRLRMKSDSPSTRLLVSQLKDFPAGDHDDGPDALEMAIRLAVELSAGPPTDDGLGSRLPVSE
jgi:predicted phage terminase large subunit-like protein